MIIMNKPLQCDSSALTPVRSTVYGITKAAKRALHKAARGERIRTALTEESLPHGESTPSHGYTTPEEAVALETPTAGEAAVSLEEYKQLKKQILGRAQRAGGFLALYLFLQQGLVATLCSLSGTVAGFAYLQLLIREVDTITLDTEVPLHQAQQIDSQPLRGLAITLAAYRQAIKPRLLVPIALACAVSSINNQSSQPLSNLQEFDMLLGFLCYKAGLFLKLYDDMKPKFDSQMPQRPVKPVLADLPDIDAEEKERRQRDRQRH